MGKIFSIPLRESQLNSRGKIGKVEGAVEGNLASFNLDGSIVDSGIRIAADDLVDAVINEVINKAKADLSETDLPVVEENEVATDDFVENEINTIIDSANDAISDIKSILDGD